MNYKCKDCHEELTTYIICDTCDEYFCLDCWVKYENDKQFKDRICRRCRSFPQKKNINCCYGCNKLIHKNKIIKCVACKEYFCYECWDKLHNKNK